MSSNVAVNRAKITKHQTFRPYKCPANWIPRRQFLIPNDINYEPLLKPYRLLWAFDCSHANCSSGSILFLSYEGTTKLRNSTPSIVTCNFVTLQTSNPVFKLEENSAKSPRIISRSTPLWTDTRTYISTYLQAFPVLIVLLLSAQLINNR